MTENKIIKGIYFLAQKKNGKTRRNLKLRTEYFYYLTQIYRRIIQKYLNQQWYYLNCSVWSAIVWSISVLETTSPSQTVYVYTFAVYSLSPFARSLWYHESVYPRIYLLNIVIEICSYQEDRESHCKRSFLRIQYNVNL